MALIGEIRNRAGFLVLIFVGVALLAFLLMDISGSSRGAISGGQSLGKVNGQDVSFQIYEQKVNDAYENFRNSTQGASLDDATTESIRNQTWNSYVSEIVANGEYKKLGLEVPTEELREMMLGSNPHPSVANSFRNPQTGQFDPTLVQEFVTNLDQDDDRGLAADKRRRWNSFKNFIQKDALDSKYKAMVKKGAFIPDFLVNNDFAANNTKVSLDYIQLPYAEVVDSEVQITDAELQTYLDNNKNKFDDEATRNISYVEFPLTPSEADTLDARNYVKEKVDQFRTAENDTQFVNLYSENPFQGMYQTRQQLTGKRANRLFNAAKGAVVGPYEEEGVLKIAKVMDKRNVPDSVDCRHILIDPNKVGGAAIADARADSILNVLRAGGDFDFLAADFSSDASNAENGGNLGFAKPGQMVQQFNDVLFYKGEPGNFYKVATQFGYHIVELLEKAGGKQAVLLGYVTKEIEPGGKTQKNIYRSANEFAGKNRDAAAFNNAVKELDYIDKQANSIKINDFSIPGMGSAREIVKWAYGAELGEVSEVFALDDKYIVANLNNIKEDGKLTVDGLRDELEAAVKKAKRASVLSAKMADARGKNLNQKAKNLGLEIQTADDVNLRSGFLTGAGSEPAVIGKAFSMNKGDFSEPIEGNGGVFMVKVSDKTEAGAPSAAELTRQTLKTSLSSQVDATMMNNLSKSVEVKDQRYKFY